MICSGVCPVRLLVESPAQSGRLKTLLHPGLVSGVHVTVSPCQSKGGLNRWLLPVKQKVAGETPTTLRRIPFYEEASVPPASLRLQTTRRMAPAAVSPGPKTIVVTRVPGRME
jgi:hypothetical protein